MNQVNNYFKNKKITLLGLGILGRGVGDAEYLAKQGADLTVTDLKSADELSKSVNRLKKFKNIKYSLGGHKLSDFNNRDLIIKAAGVPLDSIYVKEAKKNKVPVEMSTALFVRLSGAKIIGITGTRGKSTVVHLLEHIFKVAKKKVYLGGNVRGMSTLALLDRVKKGDWVLLELDSWQLQGFGVQKISPNISVFTNILEDHLNYYRGNMRKYLLDKANILKYQNKKDILITNKVTLKKIKLQIKGNLEAQNLLSNNFIEVDKWRSKLVGEHNKENIRMAVMVARKLNVSEGDTKRAVASFKGVPGRLELIRIVKGVAYYNDTTATMPDATIAAIKAFHGKNIVLIAGGNNKNLKYGILLKWIKKNVKKLVLLPGSATDIIVAKLGKGIDYSLINDMNEAVNIARNNANKGDVVLLSPGATSFGTFKNEFDRGDHFYKEVRKI